MADNHIDAGGHKVVVGDDGVATVEQLTAQDIAQRKVDAEAGFVKRAAREAEAARLDAIGNDTLVQEMMQRIATSSNADIDVWFAANCMTAKEVISVVKTLVKMEARRLRRGR